MYSKHTLPYILLSPPTRPALSTCFACLSSLKKISPFSFNFNHLNSSSAGVGALLTKMYKNSLAGFNGQKSSGKKCSVVSLLVIVYVLCIAQALHLAFLHSTLICTHFYFMNHIMTWLWHDKTKKNFLLVFIHHFGLLVCFCFGVW